MASLLEHVIEIRDLQTYFGSESQVVTDVLALCTTVARFIGMWLDLHNSERR
ncbi:MAG TPA: hypothetical protein VE735_08140 [Gammaproteobacteria bacterium]|jgi:hypothetical protein|nr:hypothetical protein [Gammaproteobacteria bacterium]